MRGSRPAGGGGVEEIRVDRLPWEGLRRMRQDTNGGHAADVAMSILQSTMAEMSARYTCRPPRCAESKTTDRPSRLAQGCVSHRHSPR